MVRARVDNKPQYKPIPKPPIRGASDVIKEAAEQAGLGGKLGEKLGEKLKMKDDKYEGKLDDAWEKLGDKFDKDMPDAPDVGDVLEGVVEAAENVVENVADALNPFN